VWDALTGEEKHVLNGHTNWVNSVAFSSDGSRIVSGSQDKSVRVWDALTGEEKHVLNGHTNSVNSVAFSSDGSRIVSGSDGQIGSGVGCVDGRGEACAERPHIFGQVGRIFKRWQPHCLWLFGQFGSGVGCVDGRGEACAERPHNSVNSVAFSSDGSRIVSGSWDKSVRVWDALTGEEKHVLNGHTHWVKSVAFSSDGSRIVSGSGTNSVRVWDALTGEEKHVLNGHTDSVNSVAFSSDGSRIVSGSRTIRFGCGMR
jgi:WD40 repeat protein